MRVEITSWTFAGRWLTNHAIVSRVEALERRWKSSSTSATSSLLGERVDQPRQHDLAQRRAGGGRVEAERGDHVRPQHDRVVVALVERHPRDRPPLQLGLAPGGEQRRLAEAGRARDQREAAALAVTQALEEPLARDRLCRDERRMELGDEEDAPTLEPR